MSNSRIFCVAFFTAVGIGSLIADHFAKAGSHIQSNEGMILWGLVWASVAVGMFGDRHEPR